MENVEDISINIVQEEYNNKKITVTFKYEQNDEIYECNENEKIKDLLSNFINSLEIEKDLKEAFLLYNGSKIDYNNKTFKQIIKSYEENITISVYFIGDNMKSNSINSDDSINLFSINNDQIDDKKENLIIQNYALKTEKKKKKTKIIENICLTFSLILYIFVCLGCCIIDESDSSELFLVHMNRNLFYQSCIIGIINIIDYYYDWNAIYIESSKSIKITFFVVSSFVALLCLGIIANIYSKVEKEKEKEKKEKERYKKELEKEKEKENGKEKEKEKESEKESKKEKEKESHKDEKIILYIYQFFYIPIIIFYCFLLASIVKKDYILCMTSIIIAINFFSLASCLIMGCDRDNICLIFLSFIFQILCIYLDLNNTFHYWKEVKEGKTYIIIITIVYFLYLFICTQISYYYFQKDIYEIGVVLADYIILFPIAFFIYAIIVLSLMLLYIFA